MTTKPQLYSADSNNTSTATDSSSHGANHSNPCSPPTIVHMGVNSKDNKRVYDQWAHQYAHDIRTWGYDMPEQVATFLVDRVKDDLSDGGGQQVQVLDAGAGDGLSGVALRGTGLLQNAHIVANDVSEGMLDMAQDCYEERKVVDLNETPYDYDTNQFDIVTCVGTLTYLDPSKGVLDEFIRITRPNGYICYTNRTDKVDKWSHVERQLEEEKKWELVEISKPLPYLPLNPDYGEHVQVTMRLFHVL